MYVIERNNDEYKVRFTEYVIGVKKLFRLIKNGLLTFDQYVLLFFLEIHVECE